jgi:hypothetical protein
MFRVNLADSPVLSSTRTGYYIKYYSMLVLYELVG